MKVTPPKLSNPSKDDVFHNHVFVADPKEGPVLRHKKLFQEVSELFHQLGTTSCLSWALHFFSLRQKEKNIWRTRPHPLEFLYFIFCDRQHISHIVHFRKESIDNEGFLKSLTKRNPWEKLLFENAANLGKRGDETRQMIPGFCKALNLNEQQIQSFARKKQWESLILYVFDERKKQFNI